MGWGSAKEGRAGAEGCIRGAASVCRSCADARKTAALSPGGGGMDDEHRDESRGVAACEQGRGTSSVTCVPQCKMRVGSLRRSCILCRQCKSSTLHPNFPTFSAHRASSRLALSWCSPCQSWEGRPTCRCSASLSTVRQRRWVQVRGQWRGRWTGNGEGNGGGKGAGEGQCCKGRA